MKEHRENSLSITLCKLRTYRTPIKNNKSCFVGGRQNIIHSSKIAYKYVSYNLSTQLLQFYYYSVDVSTLLISHFSNFPLMQYCYLGKARRSHDPSQQNLQRDKESLYY